MKLDVQVDTASVQAMLRQVGPVAAKHLQAASLVTGRRVSQEAGARFNRQTSGSGETVRNLRVQETETSVLVYVGPTSRPAGLAGWLEWGTRRMVARPWLLNSARLEEGPHLRRVSDALQTAIDEVST